MNIEEIVGKEGADHLRKHFGKLADSVGLKIKPMGTHTIVETELLIKAGVSLNHDKYVRVMEVGAAIAKIEEVIKDLYPSNKIEESGICIDNNLPKDGVFMSYEVRSKLMRYDRFLIDEIEKALTY